MRVGFRNLRRARFIAAGFSLLALVLAVGTRDALGTHEDLGTHSVSVPAEACHLVEGTSVNRGTGVHSSSSNGWTLRCQIDLFDSTQHNAEWFDFDAYGESRGICEGGEFPPTEITATLWEQDVDTGSSLTQIAQCFIAYDDADSACDANPAGSAVETTRTYFVDLSVPDGEGDCWEWASVRIKYD